MIEMVIEMGTPINKTCGKFLTSHFNHDWNGDWNEIEMVIEMGFRFSKVFREISKRKENKHETQRNGGGFPNFATRTSLFS